jgi:Tol biopolymer transport system component
MRSLQKTYAAGAVILMMTAFAASARAAGNQDTPAAMGRIALIDGGDLYTINATGGDRRRLTHFDESCSAAEPSWDAGDSLIAFTVTQGGSFPQLWLVTDEGRNPHKVIDDHQYAARTPAFSSDGTEIGFSRCRADGACAIAAVDIRGETVRQITAFQEGKRDLYPEWSIDGRTIAFVVSPFASSAAAAEAGLYLTDARGVNRYRLTPPDMEASWPSWSPDGASLIFSGRPRGSGVWSIWTVARDGSGLRQLLNGHAESEGNPALSYLRPSWSPDGAAFVVERFEDGGAEEIEILPAGSESFVHPGRHPRWSQSPKSW